MQAEFNCISGHFIFSHPNMPATLIRGATAWVMYRFGSGKIQQAQLAGQGCSIHEETVEDVHGTGRQQIIHCPTNRDGIELTYRINIYDQRPFLLLQLSLCNQGPESIYLHELCLFHAEPSTGGYVQLCRPVAGLRFFKVGWHGWDFAGLRQHDEHNTNSKLGFLTSLSYSNPVTPITRSLGEFWSEGWGVLADGWAAMVTGFVSTAHQFGQVHACTRPGEGALTLITQMDEVRLDPKESIESEWGYLQFVQLPNPEPAAEFVGAVARQMQARVPDSPPPPMWTHWYNFYHNINEQLFLQNLDALTEHRTDVPYQVVELDDGYQSAWGDWTVTNARFPRGLEWLADQIIARKFTPGLWLAPFVVQGKSQIAGVHPDWLVKNKRGHPINAGFLYNMFIQAMDASHPGVLEHLRELTHALTHQWGYSMLKVDFLYAGALPGKRFNPKLTRAEALRLGLEAIRQGAGEGTFLLGCGCPFGPAIGVVDAMRIGPDTAPSWEPYFNWMPWAGPLIKREPSMPSLRNALRHTLNLSTLHKRWWWNDPDCLLVRDTDTHLTEVEVQTAVTLVGLSGGLLISSDDLRKLDDERLRWVRLLVPNLGLRGLPVDWLKHKMPELYRVQLQGSGQAPQAGEPWQAEQTKDWQLVALFNWNNFPADGCLRFEELGYEPGADLHVFDFWSGQYSRVTDSEMVFHDIPAHGCKLLRVSEVGTTPQLVGDTLHISQGAEIASMTVQEDRLLIETLDLGRLVEGALWLQLPNLPKTISCNKQALSFEDHGQGIYMLHVQFLGKGNIEIVMQG